MIPIIPGSPRLQRPFEVLQIQLLNHGLQEKCPSLLLFSRREYLPTQLLLLRQFSDGLQLSEGLNIPRIERWQCHDGTIVYWTSPQIVSDISLVSHEITLGERGGEVTLRKCRLSCTEAWFAEGCPRSRHSWEKRICIAEWWAGGVYEWGRCQGRQ